MANVVDAICRDLLDIVWQWPNIHLFMQSNQVVDLTHLKTKVVNRDFTTATHIEQTITVVIWALRIFTEPENVETTYHVTCLENIVQTILERNNIHSHSVGLRSIDKLYIKHMRVVVRHRSDLVTQVRKVVWSLIEKMRNSDWKYIVNLDRISLLLHDRAMFDNMRVMQYTIGLFMSCRNILGLVCHVEERCELLCALNACTEFHPEKLAKTKSIKIKNAMITSIKKHDSEYERNIERIYGKKLDNLDYFQVEHYMTFILQWRGFSV
jgi:hypothetical protein